MRMDSKLVLCAAVAGASLWAQGGGAPDDKAALEIRHLEHSLRAAAAPMAGQAATMKYIAHETNIGGKTVTNSPFSATGVSEFTQVLADGTRINRKQSSALYRDSQGRTRREQTLAAIGPWVSSGEPPTTIVISDPVAKQTFMLFPNNKTYRKMESMEYAPAAMSLPHSVTAARPAAMPHAAPGENAVFIQKQVVVAHAPGGGAPAAGAVAHFDVLTHRSDNTASENLGTQTVEGVAAEGVRTTNTIPTGAIGNDRPITVVSERWFSPDLQTIVMNVNRDPMAGETVYRLTNINRAEPPANLFQVPADYTLLQPGPTVVIEEKEGK